MLKISIYAQDRCILEFEGEATLESLREFVTTFLELAQHVHTDPAQQAQLDRLVDRSKQATAALGAVTARDTPTEHGD